MEKSNTRQEILDAALDLFSVNGYEATSISQLADAVGIRKASLYSHFANKQEILDKVVEMVLDGYYRHSIFANADWNDPKFIKDKKGMKPEDYAKAVRGHIRYIIHDPQIKKGRMLLMIEQFRNEELSKLHTKMNYDDVLAYFTGMIRFLIREKKLADGNPELMAVHLCLPITVWINLCDREPDREEEVLEMIERHIRQFFEVYRR